MVGKWIPGTIVSFALLTVLSLINYAKLVNLHAHFLPGTFSISSNHRFAAALPIKAMLSRRLSRSVLPAGMSLWSRQREQFIASNSVCSCAFCLSSF
jgi:hypothetical protein